MQSKYSCIQHKAHSNDLYIISNIFNSVDHSCFNKERKVVLQNDGKEKPSPLRLHIIGYLKPTQYPTPRVVTLKGKCQKTKKKRREKNTKKKGILSFFFFFSFFPLFFIIYLYFLTFFFYFIYFFPFLKKNNKINKKKRNANSFLTFITRQHSV
jgi:hypothetical protein